MQNLAEHRRETAEKELGSTHVKRYMCVISLTVFGVFLLSVPFCQFISEVQRGEFPYVFRAVDLLSDPHREAIEKYEDRLEEKSVLTNWLLPNVQTILTGLLHTGNEQAYLGQNGWLFYRADIDSLIVAKSVDLYKPHKAAYSDALRTIIDFKNQLAARNITLIVMPTPVKPSIHPEKFSVRHKNPNASVQNPNYAKFVEALVSQDVLVYDPFSILFDAAQHNVQYLKTDTHWRPEAMERVAEYLAAFITKHIKFVNDPVTAYTKTATEIENVGDITKMLNLPKNQNLFPSELVTTHVIQTQSGELWQPDRDAEILFLGDSFSNIYSLAGMGWGKSAGFVEHLSAELARPIDKIVINAGGALATRQALAKQPNRLESKRVVVYQFATRELFAGNWEQLLIPQTQSESTKPTSLNKDITVTAFIKDKTVPPVPGTVPYSECIIALHLENVKISELPKELVVFVWGMRENRWTEAATFKIGQRVALRLRPWNSVQADYESYNRKELENEEAWLLDVYWGEVP